MELILLRHAQTPGNLLRQYIGSTDEPLAPQGEAQARAAASELPSVQRVYSSPLLRCRQTSALCFPGVPLTVLDGLRETDFGDFERKTYEELKDVPEYVRWLESGGKLAFPNGEDPKDASARAVAALDRILSDDRDIKSAAVVAHGGTIMAIMSARGIPARSYYDWQIKNCAFLRVRADAGKLYLL